MSSVLKENKNKENIDCAMKTLYKMKEKREWAEKESIHIVAAICEPFIKREEYILENNSPDALVRLLFFC